MHQHKVILCIQLNQKYVNILKSFKFYFNNDKTFNKILFFLYLFNNKNELSDYETICIKNFY